MAYLASQLPDTVNELDKNRRTFCIRVVFIAMTDTLEDNQYNYVNIMLSRNLLNKKTNIYLLEAMSETQPLFLNQNFKAPNGAVVPVQHEHGQ